MMNEELNLYDAGWAKNSPLVYMYKNNYYDARTLDRTYESYNTLYKIANVTVFNQYNYPLIYAQVEGGALLLSFDNTGLHEIRGANNVSTIKGHRSNNVYRYIIVQLPDAEAIPNLSDLPNLPARKLKSLPQQLIDLLDRQPKVSVLLDKAQKIAQNEAMINPEYHFIPFEQITQMITQNQIANWTIDPNLQSSVGIGSNYRIFTFFGNNGMTYLVKARYDPQTNQIFP